MLLTALPLLAVLDLGTLFAEKETWNEQAEFFAVEHQDAGFGSASNARDIVNCLRHDTCAWHGLRVWETRVYFEKGDEGKDEKIVRVELSLYNRGDAGLAAIDEAELAKTIAAVTAKLAPGEKKAKPERIQLPNGSFQFRCRFDKTAQPAELVWGLSAADDRKARVVEYLRLTLFNPATPTKRLADAKKPVRKDGKKSTVVKPTRSSNGDVYIESVPMVDQGQKGYCSAAVAERVLRYYGRRVDEHEIAQQAETEADGGTSVSKMKEVVKSVGAKNGLGYQEIVSLSAGLGDLEDEVARYNKAAKAEKKPALSLDQFVRGNTIYVSEMRAAMDKKVIYRMRQKDARLKKFSAGIRQQVNVGIPVFWGVTLGIFPERGVNLQTTGGHMRLIIGYNDKKKEILYTDTWGEGHELKRMPEDWAFAITHDAFFLKPR